MGSLSGPRVPPLVGRSAELKGLGQVLQDASAGRPWAMVVHGEAGVGKTRLVAEACRQFRRQLRANDGEVLWGACVHFGAASLPYGPLVGALRSWTDAVPEPRRLAVLAGDQDLDALLTRAWTAADDSPRLLPLIGEAVNRIAGRAPTVLVVDDLQWADASSLDVLSYLIAGFRDQRLAVLATCRDENRPEGHPLHGWLADMRRMPHFDELHLDRLDQADTETLVAALLGETVNPELTVALGRRADGNPYLTELLVRGVDPESATVPEGTPRALREALTAAWHGLSPNTREVVRVLAVGGRPMSQAVLSGVGTLLGSAWSLGASISEAESEGVVRRHTRGTVWFRHPLLAEVLYDETPADLARELHAAYAQVISSLDGASRTRYAGDLAAHYERAGNADEAFVWSLRAADSAAGLHASAEAAIHLARACQLAQRLSPDVRPSDADLVALLLRASRAVEFVGDQAQAMRFVERAVMLVDRERQPLLMSTLLVSWSRLRWQRDAPTRSVQPESLEALRLTDPYPDSAERAAALSELAGLESWDGHRAKAALLAEEAVAVARRAGSPVALAGALCTRAMVDLSLSTAWEDAGEAYQLARATRSADVMVDAAIWQSNYLQAKEKVAEAAELAREAFEEGLRLGALHWCYFLAGMAAADLIGLGRWDEARALLREALAARCAGIPGALVRFVSAQLATRTGDLHQARQHLERAFELISPGFPGLSYSAYLAESEVLLAEGDARAAVTLTTTAVLKASERDGAVAADDLLWPVGSLAAVAQQARDAGDVACADRVQDELAAFLSEVRCPELAVDPARDPALAASRALLDGELARCRATADEAAVWKQAVAANEAIGARWRQVYGMWRWAQALLRAGAPRRQVVAVLRPAHAMAAGMGATVLADELAFLARGMRVTLDAPWPAVRDSAARNAVVLDGHPADGAAPHADGNGALPGLLSRLTEREREVLGHLIAGRSNSEIARTLVISAKTVSVHVSNILAKTGTTSRTDAAALARRLGCPAP